MKRLALTLVALALGCAGSDHGAEPAGGGASPEDTTREPSSPASDAEPNTPGDPDAATPATPDADAPVDPDPDTPPDTPTGPATGASGDPDYRAAGEQQVEVSQASFEGTSCQFTYDSFTPQAPAEGAAVVLVPGFAFGAGLGSSREAMAGLAQHIASWGVTVHAVSLCTNGPSIDHAKNGEAIAELGASLAPARVVYAGFSAGGLAAALATAKAGGDAAFFGLDAVDANDQAAAALDAIGASFAVAGEPSSCNSDENMLAVYRDRPVRVLKVNGAQHFVFEGSVCEGIKCALCQGGGEPEVAAVRALTTAFLRGHFGLDGDALARWWQAGGARLGELVDAGLVTELQ